MPESAFDVNRPTSSQLDIIASADTTNSTDICNIEKHSTSELPVALKLVKSSVKMHKVRLHHTAYKAS